MSRRGVRDFDDKRASVFWVSANIKSDDNTDISSTIERQGNLIRKDVQQVKSSVR